MLKPAKLIMPQGPWLSRKKCVTFLSGRGGGSPEKRPYYVSCRQNRYVTFHVNNSSVDQMISVLKNISRGYRPVFCMKTIPKCVNCKDVGG